MSESIHNDDVIRLAQAASDSLTDSMIERLSITGSNAIEVIDRLNDEDTRDAVMSLIDKVTDMHRSGALNTLFELLTLVHGVRDAMTDRMAERLFTFIEHMLNNLATEELAEMAHRAQGALQEAAIESETMGKPKGGLVSTISMLGKPETQQALQFLLTFANKMQKSTADESS